jgi:hypothetical protein
MSMMTIIATKDGIMGRMIVLPASRGASTGRPPNNVVVIGITGVRDPPTWVLNLWDW